MLVFEEENKVLYDEIQRKNLVRQYDLMTNCIQIGLSQGARVFDKYMLWDLNHVAVANISQFAGRFREEPIYVGDHKPPHFRDVPHLMDQFLSSIHENRYEWSEFELAAYALWRLLWIHPFIEGNGRTARAACYYLLCVKSGGLIRGRKILPERIQEDRKPYYAALASADRAWEEGNLDIVDLANYLADLLEEQITDDGVDFEGNSSI